MVELCPVLNYGRGGKAHMGPLDNLLRLHMFCVMAAVFHFNERCW